MTPDLLRYYFFTLIVTLMITVQTSYASEQIITYSRSADDTAQRQDYFVKLLTLALEKTRNDNNHVKIEISAQHMQQGRALAELVKGNNIDIVWSVTSIDRERQLIPIRIPLLKGLIGYRVFLIRAADRHKFSVINTLDQLKSFIAGQGHDWPDTQILRANNLSVSTGTTYLGLFNMLEAKRFDYFPRGINEAWSELEQHQDKKMIIETSLMLHYPSPIYFFLNSNNSALAKRIESGLIAAIDDGSFDQLFYAYPAHKKMFELVDFKQRNIFKLQNPLLPALTPVNDLRLWFSPK
jgi:hypothetical protein